MNILLFNNSHLPLIGGKEIVVHHLAMSLMELGHNVVLAGPGSYRRFRHLIYPYTVFRWPRIPFLSKELTWRLLLRITRMRFKWDIVHAHTTYPNGFTAAQLKEVTDFPLIITPHGADIHKVPEIGFGHRLDPVKDKKICYALDIADFTTAISKAVEDSIADTGLEKNKIIAIPNGVDKHRFTTHVDFDVFEFLGIPRDSKVVVSVGNYHPRKGHKTLCMATQKAHEVEPKLVVVIVGNPSQKFCQEILDQGMGDFIKFTGSLRFPMPGSTDDPDILVALLHASHAYVSASIAEGTEGLSLALLEAMAAKTCVIATRVSGNRDIIINNENGLLIEPGCEESLEQALISVCSDASLVTRLAENGQQFVKKYSWLEITKLYVELYKKTLDRS